MEVELKVEVEAKSAVKTAAKSTVEKAMKSQTPSCRFCKTHMTTTFVDLGLSPISNSFVRAENAHRGEAFYPLHVYVCGECYLVQLEEFESREAIFNDQYAYFSSYSEMWLKAVSQYADMATARFGLGPSSLVTEVASNDGYLLQFFKKKGVSVLGIEPSANVAATAIQKGIETHIEFMGRLKGEQLAKDGRQADLLVGNNVVAHVPDINDFVQGLKLALKSTGVITLEFPHLLELIKHNQFDTVYHEHFSYISLNALKRVFEKNGLRVFDVERIPTHGGSLRVFGTHIENASYLETDSVRHVLADEERSGLLNLAHYGSFQKKVELTKQKTLEFLIREKQAGKKFVGYGAPAKGNTFLNYCGIRQDFIDYTVDLNPVKQGTLLPGARIPVCAPEKIFETKPDYVFILPWNIKEEVMRQMAGIREWGGQFVTAIPELKVEV